MPCAPRRLGALLFADPYAHEVGPHAVHAVWATFDAVTLAHPLFDAFDRIQEPPRLAGIDAKDDVAFVALRQRVACLARFHCLFHLTNGDKDVGAMREDGLGRASGNDGAAHHDGWWTTDSHFFYMPIIKLYVSVSIFTRTNIYG